MSIATDLILSAIKGGLRGGPIGAVAGLATTPFGGGKRRRRKRALTATDKEDLMFVKNSVGKTAAAEFLALLRSRR